MKKHLTLLLSIILVLIVLLTACTPGADTPSTAQTNTGQAQGAENTPQNTQSQEGAGNTISLSGYEFSTEPVTLTAWVDWPQSYGDWGEDLVSKWITDTVGVTIDLSFATTTTSEELNLMLISGEQLPDLIVAGGGGAVANTLVRQKYAAPLDVLAQEHFPAFMELLPGQMFEVYQEDDGHLYRTADWYADYDRMMEMQSEGYYVTDGSNQQFLLNRAIYEELGSPQIGTLADFREYMNAAKAAHPEIAQPLVIANVAWNDSQDTVNFIYRLHGGQDWLYADDSGNIQLALRDDRYKQSLQYINSLYRDGILNAEALEMAYETFESILAGCDTIAFSGQDFNWFGKVAGGDQLTGPIMPIDPPVAEGVNRGDLKFKSLLTSVGGSTAVFVTDGAVNEARAIEYLAFRYTDEAQTAERFGIQGETWEYAADGKQINWSQQYNDYIAEKDWYQMSLKFGPNNGTHSWFCTNAICKQESAEADYPVRAKSSEINAPYMQNERILDLTKVIKNDDVQMKYDQFLQLAGESIVQCIKAGDDAAFDSAYTQFLSTAENLGIADLEKYFTENYQKWLERGLS